MDAVFDIQKKTTSEHLTLIFLIHILNGSLLIREQASLINLTCKASIILFQLFFILIFSLLPMSSPLNFCTYLPCIESIVP